MNEILIVGGGIGALTLSLELKRRAIPHRIYRKARIEDVIGAAELRGISDRYQRVAGYDRATLNPQETAP